MDWQNKVSRIIDYLESRMCDEIDLEKAARHAGYSLWEFQRFFSFLTNTTVGAYIRKRKLSLAANDILTSDEKIVDIALKYGYESPGAFSRAFNQLFGVSPSSARDESVSLELYPKLDFKKIFEERRVAFMENMEKYSKRGYYITSNMPCYLTKNMDETCEWFKNVLGWFGKTIAYDDEGRGVYGAVYDYPGEIFDIISPQRGFYLFYGEPPQDEVGFMSVQGGLETLYNFVKGNGWDKITEPAVQSWGVKECSVTTIDGSVLRFQEVK
ncbi:MAG: helix-turn-helix domain-containing protein [Defluviitaleaceae bacterium]|nr:helix-turn-helix domain-containing protein [Defluviitaleaceae bacterium]MCL2274578.1 helix-turn-helix domain-containing protein [Defluviitaleaceae bacterium]